jgi:hypothetical protein
VNGANARTWTSTSPTSSGTPALALAPVTVVATAATAPATAAVRQTDGPVEGIAAVLGDAVVVVGLSGFLVGCRGVGGLKRPGFW